MPGNTDRDHPTDDTGRLSYQNRLATTIDGGGCTETWETLSQLRNRRKFLTTLLAVGAGSIGAAQPGAADHRNKNEVDPDEACTVNRCSLHECWDIVGDAVSDGRFRALYHRFRENGWRTKQTLAYIIKTTVHANHIDGLDEDVEYCTLLVPFITGRDREHAIILWQEHSVKDATNVAGFHSIHGSVANDVPDDYWRITVYTFGADGTIETEEQDLENFLGCDNVNWTCVLDIASSYAGLFAACAVCASTMTPPACAACISTVLNWMRAVRCEWCYD